MVASTDRFFDVTSSRKVGNYKTRLHSYSSLDDFLNRWNFPEPLAPPIQTQSRDNTGSDDEVHQTQDSDDENVINDNAHNHNHHTNDKQEADDQDTDVSMFQQRPQEFKVDDPASDKIENDDDDTPENKENEQNALNAMYARMRRVQWSEFLKSENSRNYEKLFCTKMKAAIEAHHALIQNVGRFTNRSSITAKQASSALQAFTIRMTQWMVGLRVYYNLPPRSDLFAQLLDLNKNDLEDAITAEYDEQYRFLEKKGFVLQSKRIKSWNKLDLDPAKLYYVNKNGKLMKNPPSILRKRKQRDNDEHWDVLDRARSKRQKGKTGKPTSRRIVDLSGDEIEDDENVQNGQNGQNVTFQQNQQSQARSGDGLSAKTYEKLLNRLDHMESTNNTVLKTVSDFAATLTAQNTNNNQSPQKKSAKEVLNDDRRGLSRWCKETAVHRTSHGFEIIAVKTINENTNTHQDIYERLMNKARKGTTTTTKDVVDHVQGMLGLPT